MITGSVLLLIGIALYAFGSFVWKEPAMIVGCIIAVTGAATFIASLIRLP